MANATNLKYGICVYGLCDVVAMACAASQSADAVCGKNTHVSKHWNRSQPCVSGLRVEGVSRPPSENKTHHVIGTVHTSEEARPYQTNHRLRDLVHSHPCRDQWALQEFHLVKVLIHDPHPFQRRSQIR